MAGHSHWAGIKHKKALVDNKRGKLWSKLSKAVIIAAKLGGGDPGMNIRLRTAIADAKAGSMPKDTIERAIKKGTGELDGGNFEEVLYEGYGPGGVAVLCDIMTDNRNRTAPEIRKIFDSYNGKLGGTNCVAWMFERKGLFVIPADTVPEDQLMEAALEAGADDVKQVGENFEVTCDPEKYANVARGFGDSRNRRFRKRGDTDPEDHRGLARGRCPESHQAARGAGRSRRRAECLGQLRRVGRSAGRDRSLPPVMPGTTRQVTGDVRPLGGAAGGFRQITRSMTNPYRSPEGLTGGEGGHVGGLLPGAEPRSWHADCCIAAWSWKLPSRSHSNSTDAASPTACWSTSASWRDKRPGGASRLASRLRSRPEPKP